MVESSSQLDTATIDVRDWQQLVELGSGRTGTVTLCVEPPDTNSSRTPKTATATYGQDHRICHAIKLVKRQCVTSGGGARRLLRERDALKALKGHPGIVELRFTSKDDQNLYFILEPLLGGALHKHIRAAGHLETAAARFYASEVTSAVVHMHSLRFMHRDLKASNIVLCSRGHAKLVDLGCVKQLPEGSREDGDGDAGDPLKSYTYCGTPHCMAPEMISREGHTPAVDWWALGILIHEMVAGEPPFGYGGDGLSVRISAGLPNTRGSADLGKTHAEHLAAERQSDTGTTNGQAAFLPIVRRLLDTDSQQRLGSAAGAEDVTSHDWFEAVQWKNNSKHELEPPPFRKDLGELDALEDGTKGNARDVDPDGLFDNF